jgi:16S rRNA (guanine966-N2)-methyltransferase
MRTPFERVLTMSKRNLEQTVRIIGGNWRSRKVSFAEHEQIRPTPARVRETLYAGSGILSLEALSRGAKHVTLVEKENTVWRHLLATCRGLAEDDKTYDCHNMTAQAFVAAASDNAPYDLIFLDPPFGSRELIDLLPRLTTDRLLAAEGRIYIESEFAVTQSIIGADWEIFRQKQAGSVHYCLCRRRPED